MRQNNKIGSEWRRTHKVIMVLVVVGQKNISRSNFKLILCCFLPNFSKLTKFHQNRMINIEVKEISYWSLLFGRPSRSKKSRSHFTLILYCVLPNIFPPPEFIQSRMKKTRKMKIFAIGWLWRPTLFFKNTSLYLNLNWTLILGHTSKVFPLSRL